MAVNCAAVGIESASPSNFEVSAVILRADVGAVADIAAVHIKSGIRPHSDKAVLRVFPVFIHKKCAAVEIKCRIIFNIYRRRIIC